MADPVQEVPESTFNRHFLPVFATLLIGLASAYIWGITFIQVPKDNQRVVDTVLGFLLGSVVGAVIKFYFDSTRGGQLAQKTVAEIAKAPAPPSSPVFPQADSTTVVTGTTSEETKP